jgi:adenylate cyclase
MDATSGGGPDLSSFLEVERKFLVTSQAWPAPVAIQRIEQCYLTEGDRVSVRVRCKDGGYWLTLKSGVSTGVRHEFEFAIPADQGRAMMERLPPNPAIVKRRYIVRDGGLDWEVDVFEGQNAGLIIAELEHVALDQPIPPLSWLGPEVTADARFTNHALSRHPFSRWGVSYSSLLGV